MRRTAALLLATALFGAWLFAPLFEAGIGSLDHDFTRFVIDREAVRVTVDRFGELPLRSPYLGGGVASFAHPHNPAVHPSILLTHAFGSLMGMKLEFVLGWLAWVLGFWALGSNLKPGARVFLAATAAALPWVSHRLFGGDIPELQYLYAPLLLAACLHARRSRAALVGAALLLASISLVGAYRVVLIGLLPAIWMASERLAERQGRKLVGDAKLLAVVAGAALLVALPRLIPAAEATLGSDRLQRVWAQDFQDVRTLLRMVLVPPTAEGATFAWNHWVGPLVPPLALLGLFAGRKAAPAAVVTLGSALLALGPNSPVDVWPLVSRLPILSTLTAAPKQASAFLILGLLFLAALGVERLEGAALKRGWGRPAAAALALLLLAQGVYVGHQGKHLQQTALTSQMRGAPTKVAADDLVAGRLRFPTEARQRFQTLEYGGELLPSEMHVMLYAAHEYSLMLYWLHAGYGQIRWWDTFFGDAPLVPSHIVDGGVKTLRPNPAYRGEIWSGAGPCVSLKSLTARSLIVQSDCPARTTAVLNQRYHRGWGPRAGNADGLLAVPIAAGETVELGFSLPGIVRALPALLFGLLWLAWLGNQGTGRDRRWALGMVAATALYVLGGTAALALLGPDGADCAPGEATDPLPLGPGDQACGKR